MLISQVVDTITAIQADPTLKPLVFVVPISLEALELSGRSAAELENICQGALEKSLNDALMPVNAA